MELLSHRGFWLNAHEKNQAIAFHRSFQEGFGTETDIRDFGEELKISHDSPNKESMTLEEFLHIYNQYNQPGMLALNIKSCGLQERVRNILNSLKIKNYFVFDMAIPDTLGYIKKNILYFTRHSDVEEPLLYSDCTGVWMDIFYSDWIQENDVIKHLDADKKVCIVSPELHGRPHNSFWTRIKSWSPSTLSNIMLCTDMPTQARNYFND